MQKNGAVRRLIKWMSPIRGTASEIGRRRCGAMRWSRTRLRGTLIMAYTITLFSFCLADESTPCKGEEWPCRTGCYRAELLSIKAGCSVVQTDTGSVCCLYLYALYRCRTDPNCQGDDCGNTCQGDDCGNTQEVVVRIRSSGDCQRITTGTPGYRCSGGGEVRDGGGNSDGWEIVLPSECGRPVQARLVLYWD